jgi:hypothetical protein
MGAEALLAKDRWGSQLGWQKASLGQINGKTGKLGILPEVG